MSIFEMDLWTKNIRMSPSSDRDYMEWALVWSYELYYRSSQYKVLSTLYKVPGQRLCLFLCLNSNKLGFTTQYTAHYHNLINKDNNPFEHLDLEVT